MTVKKRYFPAPNRPPRQLLARSSTRPQSCGQFALASHFGRRSAAQGALKAAAAMVPEDDELQYALSRAHRNAGAFADAELAMERVVALRRAHLPPTLQEGLAYLRSRPGIEPSRLALEWAWHNLSPPGAIRTQWESAARFGQASNALICPRQEALHQRSLPPRTCLTGVARVLGAIWS
jgi:hypothetical protein